MKILIKKKQQGGRIPEPVVVEKGEYARDNAGQIVQVDPQAPSHDDGQLVLPTGQSRTVPQGRGGVMALDLDSVLSASQEQINRGDRANNPRDAVIKIKPKEANELAQEFGLKLNVTQSVSPSKFFEKLLDSRDKQADKLIKALGKVDDSASRQTLNAVEVNQAQLATLPSDEDLYQLAFQVQEGKKAESEEYPEIVGMMQQGGWSTDGYKSDSPDRFNDFNLIPSNQITMEGVDQPLLLYGDGGEIVFAEPGQEYELPQSESVLEVPLAQAGSSFAQRRADKLASELMKLAPVDPRRADLIQQLYVLAGYGIRSSLPVNQWVEEHPAIITGPTSGSRISQSNLYRQGITPIQVPDYLIEPTNSIAEPVITGPTSTRIVSGIRVPVNRQPTGQPETELSFIPGGEIPDLIQPISVSSVRNRKKQTTGKRTGRQPFILATGEGNPAQPDWTRYDQNGLPIPTIQPLTSQRSSIPTSIPLSKVNPARDSTQAQIPASVSGSDVAQLPTHDNPYQLSLGQIMPELFSYVDATQKTANTLYQQDFIPLNYNDQSANRSIQELDEQFLNSLAALDQSGVTGSVRNAQLTQLATSLGRAKQDVIGQVQQANRQARLAIDNQNAQTRMQVQAQNNQYQQVFDQQNKLRDEAARQQQLTAIQSMIGKELQAEQDQRNYNFFKSTFAPKYYVDKDGNRQFDQTSAPIQFNPAIQLATSPEVGETTRRTRYDAEGKLKGQVITQKQLDELEQFYRFRKLMGLKQQGGKLKKYQLG